MDLPPPPEQQADQGRAPGIPVHVRQRMAAAQAAARANMAHPFACNSRSWRLQETSKRQRTSGPETQTTMIDSASAVFKFEVDYEQTKNLAIGEAVHSDAVSAGEHMWRVNCYPRGTTLVAPNGECLSIFVELLGKSRSVRAMFEVLLITKGGVPGITNKKKTRWHDFQMGGDTIGWDMFLSPINPVKNFVTDGQIIFFCSIVVVQVSSIPVPPSDIGENLSALLDSGDGADVSFTVDGETFHAHRVVLAARSEVFRVELLGSMAEATMPSITLHDIAPEIFRAMLGFMYTDALPGDDELAGDDSPTEIFERLLAAADLYALDRLKLMCTRKLLEGVSVDNVADALVCAEIYNCPELMNKCIDFVAEEKNFKKAVLTEGFMELGYKFPSIVHKVKKRVGE